MAFDGQTEVFEYTDALAVSGSSFVDSIAYDAVNKELLVVLDSGDYLYQGVPADVFSNFKNAHSKGQFYNNWIKRGPYAPGELVYVDDVAEKTFVAPAMGPISLDPNAHAVSPPTSHSILGHDVQFVVEGGNGLKHYHVETGSVEDAVDALYAAVAPLGLNVTVKGVYTSFE